MSAPGMWAVIGRVGGHYGLPRSSLWPSASDATCGSENPVDLLRAARHGRLRIRADELGHWDRLSRRLRVPFHADGVISQSEGYEHLAEFDSDGYRARYDDIGRFDLILAAEGDSPNNYRLAK
jgi:trehalose/maltose hydrolase-like predicted phosphorylase